MKKKAYIQTDVKIVEHQSQVLVVTSNGTQEIHVNYGDPTPTEEEDPNGSRKGCWENWDENDN